MKDESSPEDKLLNLIKNQKQSPDGPAAKKGAIPAAGASKAEAVSRIQGLARELALALDIRKIIYILLVFASLYLVAALVYPYFGSKAIKFPEVEALKPAESGRAASVKKKSFEFYSEGIKKRDIFGATYSQEAPEEAAAVSLDLASAFNLVGIMAGDNPQAVIEDKAANKTFYAVRGQSFGEFKVEEILESKVILSSRGKRYELSL